ncbi:hypothetical protein [Methanocella sp. MCL-LM]|uniref:hypothetical protein n=1 Tax=Methanocella sp. MCL-LM TaxID=3412035 RepID=UPI003C70E1A8
MITLLLIVLALPAAAQTCQGYTYGPYVPSWTGGTAYALGCPGCPGCPDNPIVNPGEPGCYALNLGCPGCPGCPDYNATPGHPGGPGCLILR